MLPVEEDKLSSSNQQKAVVDMVTLTHEYKDFSFESLSQDEPSEIVLTWKRISALSNSSHER
jgi:hypothetical protein